jgi:hypothetical protein
MSIVRIALCLNIEDPEQKELFDFVTVTPKGKKRNASAFLKMLVDREYQKRKGEQQKETLKAPRVEGIKSNNGITYLPNKNINKDPDSSTNGTAD